MPWLARFALPSLLSIAVTYLVLRWTQRALAKEEIAAEVARPELPWTGRVAGLGIIVAGVVLLTPLRGMFAKSEDAHVTLLQTILMIPIFDPLTRDKPIHQHHWQAPDGRRAHTGGSFHIWNPRESPNGGFVLVREVQN
jgi:Na+/H+ antiporter NhaD/arsenite permease-like protein